MMGSAGERCLRTSIHLKGISALAWEIFTGPGKDQFTGEGRYDYTLAIKLFECFGLEPWHVVEAVDKLSIIVREVKYWTDQEREREESEEARRQAAFEALEKLP